MALNFHIINEYLFHFDSLINKEQEEYNKVQKEKDKWIQESMKYLDRWYVVLISSLFVCILSILFIFSAGFKFIFISGNAMCYIKIGYFLSFALIVLSGFKLSNHEDDMKSTFKYYNDCDNFAELKQYKKDTLGYLQFIISYMGQLNVSQTGLVQQIRNDLENHQYKEARNNFKYLLETISL